MLHDRKTPAVYYRRHLLQCHLRLYPRGDDTPRCSVTRPLGGHPAGNLSALEVYMQKRDEEILKMLGAVAVDFRSPQKGRDVRVIQNARALRCSCDNFYNKSGADYTTIK